MLIPYKFSVGAKEYKVLQSRALPNCERGRVFYWDNIIRLATHRMGKVVPHRRKVHAFWHETTHAILHDMGHFNLRDNEEFVDAFAKRLTQIVHTAQVK
jgi:hypothetical protein